MSYEYDKRLPATIPSNMTDEEFLNLLDERAPLYVRERFAEYLGMREKLEEGDADADNEIERLQARVGKYEAAVEKLRETWDELEAETITPQITAIEKAVSELEEIGE